MHAPRLLDAHLKADNSDSDRPGHRTYTSVWFLSLLFRRLLTLRTASRRRHAARLSTTESGYLPVDYCTLHGC